jgi:hypothetical protein
MANTLQFFVQQGQILGTLTAKAPVFKVFRSVRQEIVDALLVFQLFIQVRSPPASVYLPPFLVLACSFLPFGDMVYERTGSDTERRRIRDDQCWLIAI